MNFSYRTIVLITNKAIFIPQIPINHISKSNHSMKFWEKVEKEIILKLMNGKYMNYNSPIFQQLKSMNNILN